MEIIVSQTSPFATIQLNRPDVRNSFNPAMIKALTEAFAKIDLNKNIRAVVLSGAGSVFCAGADLQWMQSMVNYSFDENKKDAEVLYKLFETIAECPIPVIGQIHGAAFGGALGLIATCDYVVAEKKTQFCFSEVKLGISPAVISSFIARKCFLPRIKPWMLSGAVMSSDIALSTGLVNEVADGDVALSASVEKYITSLLACGPEAVRETKKMLQEIEWLAPEEQKELTTEVIAERRVSREGQEGLKSFLEKRKPNWTTGGKI